MKILNLLEQYHYQFLFVFFLFLLSLAYTLIEYDAKNRIGQYETEQLENISINYKMIYNTNKKISRILFSENINVPDVLEIFSDINETNLDSQRNKLYLMMKEKYKFIEKMGVKQLHFHLPNSDSFLRMHKPQKYGDNLGDARYSVTYVNKKHKPISGFELGRIVHGFRFVYPLKAENGVHLGSVEVSINSDYFVKLFKNTLFIDADIIIEEEASKKKLFKGFIDEYYTQSLEGNGYLLTKNSAKEYQDELTRYLHENSDKYRADISEKLKLKKAFTHLIEVNDIHYIKVFIPIRNIEHKEVVAYFIASKPSDALKNMHQDMFYIKISIFFFLLLIIYVVHRNLRYSSTLRHKVNEAQKKLEDSQQQIIESEKMASLGTLIAGVSHEVNTPIGLGVTAMSHFLDETKHLKKRYDAQEMSQDEFEHYLLDAGKTGDIVFANLVRAAELIKSFKQISIDQSSEAARDIYVKEYIDEILLSLHNQTKKIALAITTDIDEDLHVNTYPGAWSQIFTNLILNSLIHAFDNIKEPRIHIAIKKENGRITAIYSDNGSGMDEDHRKKVFDPFFTTKRGSGGSGLGMNIVYNLVIQKLGGTITLESQKNKGVHFTMTLDVKE